MTLPAGEARAWKAFPSYRGVVPVVMYHSIGGRPSYLTTSRIQFAQQMRALKLGGFHTLTIAQYAAYVRGHAAGLPARPILLTFDDGRQDAYLAANGILRSYGFHATELAVPGWVTGHPGFSLSWDEIAQMSHGTTWNIESHFGYGPEKVQISKTGATGARLGYLQYLPAVPGRPGHPGHPGHLETFARFRKQFTGDELWGIHQFQEHLPGRPAAAARSRSPAGSRRGSPTACRWARETRCRSSAADCPISCAGSGSGESAGACVLPRPVGAAGGLPPRPVRLRLQAPGIAHVPLIQQAIAERVLPPRDARRCRDPAPPGGRLLPPFRQVNSPETPIRDGYSGGNRVRRRTSGTTNHRTANRQTVKIVMIATVAPDST